MEQSLSVLIPLAASIGFIHTLLGPDHYVPFIVMARARKWSWPRTGLITLLCGIGHVGSSIVIGAIGIALGYGVQHIQNIESVRGDWAAWTLFLFGIGYFIWGLWKGISNKPHRHFHVHEDGSIHTHQHSHVQRTVHDHDHRPQEDVNLTPWILFVAFVLGPCEPLIPVLMYPAARHSLHGIVLVALVFSAVTIATMVTIVFLGRYGLNQLPVAKFERWMHAAAGGAVALSGAAILFLGL
ncbi:MAG: sulfite exporter TauE/SafE family protein [Verrucomicrobiia bacterium]